MWVNGSEVSLAWVDNSYGGSGLDGRGVVGNHLLTSLSSLLSLSLSLNPVFFFSFFFLIKLSCNCGFELGFKFF